MTTQWECDGCHRVIEATEAEIGPEFQAGKRAKLCGCKDFMGWMLVGGGAWTDYHDKGIKPMDTVIADVAAITKKRGMN